MTATRLNVLVVEDEAIITVLIEDMLAELECSVVGPAATVAEALALTATDKIDVALLDLNLGRGETAYPVADDLTTRNIPFVFVTGYDQSVLQPPYAAHPTLEKPFGFTEFAAAMAKLTEMHATG